MEKIKSIFINVVSSFVYWVVFSILSVLVSSILSAIALSDISNNRSIPTWIICIIGFTFFINMFTFVFDIILLLKKKNKPSFPIIKSEIRYEKLRTELFFEDRENVECIREVKFKILCDRMEHVRKQFTWTGDGYRGTYVEPGYQDKYSIDEGCIRKYPPQIYDVIFAKPKKRGDKVHYKVRTEVTDKERVMLPYLSQHVTDRTDKVELVVSAPKGMIIEAVFREYADTAGKVPIGKAKRIEVKTAGNLEIYEYTVTSPQLLHVYRIEWEFDKGARI